MNKFDWTERYEKIKNDPKFLKEFEYYLEDLILKIRENERSIIKADEAIYDFIERYVVKRRKEKINQILRKKDI